MKVNKLDSQKILKLKKEFIKKINKILFLTKLFTMSSVAVSQLSAAEKEQLSISYAAFVLSGSGAEVNQASLTAVLQAAGLTVSAGLLAAVAKALKGRQVSEFFGSVGGGSSSGSSAPSAPVTQSKPAETKAPKQ